MRSFSQVMIPACALLAMVQYCPAPFIAAIPAIVAGADAATIAGVVGSAAGVAGAVEGGVAAGKGSRSVEFQPRQFRSRVKRQSTADLGLGTAPQDCHNQLGSATLTFSSPSANTVLVTGVPPACMTLVTVLTGTVDEGNPVPEGTDSVQFTNLTADDLSQIQDALNAHPNNLNAAS